VDCNTNDLLNNAINLAFYCCKYYQACIAERENSMGKIIEIESYENIPQYTGLSNTTSIETREDTEWNGHAYAICVGMIKDNGTIESYFKADKESENTEIFDKLRSDIQLIKKHVTLRNYDTMELLSGTRYFIPYKVKEHCSNKPTITDAYVDNCSNVHYSVEYEILMVADEDFKRYITVEYETEGTFSSCFFDQVEGIEDMFEEWFEAGIHGFNVDEDNNKSVTFYDDIGNNCNIDISSTRELMSMITSIRVIKCDQKILA